MPQPEVDQAPTGQLPATDSGNRSAAALERVVAALPGGGEARPGQVEMAEAVATAVTEGRHLVVRAGTGTGKTLGYLVPAILSGRRVVVATATRALQDQLATKDLPFLDEHLDDPFDWAVLKGRSNYLCAQRLAELAPGSTDADLPAGGEQLGLDHIDGFAERADPVELARLSDWARTTSTGDRADLDHEPSEAAWAAVSTTARDCPGAHRCPRGDDCFAEAARARAAAADVVVVNQHLYGIDLASDGGVLPDHDVAIIDEAHQIDDIISATAGVELAAGRFAHLARALRGILADAGDTIARVNDAGSLLTDALVGHRDRRLVTPLPTDLADALVRLRNRVEEALAALRSIPDDATDDATARAVRARQAATSLLDDIDAVAQPAEGHVLFVSGPERAPMLRLAPLDVAPLLQRQLWSRRPAVLTSATIAPGFGARLGLSAGSEGPLDVGSPFDYQANGLIYCAARLPRPTDPRWGDAAVDELAALVEAAGGRTLALFTSYRAMDHAVEALRERLSYPLLAQGDLPKPALVDRFAGDPETCLFATMSFWQGIDVPGPSLSLVSIDRLPFPRPDDPLLQARREHVGAGAFDAIDVPRAATLLAQGAGRLIRTATDRGAVAVLDPRLATARYGPKIVATLPRMRRTKDRAEIESFLRDLRGA
ncbi:MAG TPA: ATP-dependent DNA helicase [Acidimicrobiales bacterium]|nr:ATP-dependent DNA helicase [Acidimicrobiales bacterium]